MIDRLPGMMEQLNNLATVHRFLTSLEESTMFLTSIRKHLCIRTIESDRIRALSDVEADRIHTKIQEQRQLCQTHMRQFENLVQMAISYNISSITARLDGGRQAAERLTKVGLVVGVIASVVSPMGLLTSFYGMNVEEFAPGAGASLFQFWQIGMPLLLLSLVTSAFVAVWLSTNVRA